MLKLVIILGSLNLFLFQAYAEINESTQLKEVEVQFFTDESSENSFAPKAFSKKQVNDKISTDSVEIIKDIPGVYSRSEDSYGLRPNIGLRGTDPDRSKKVVLLEDGVLIGPAPYSAPAAYYHPHASQVHDVEVFKGFKSLIYGPNSIGGAINYQSLIFSGRETKNLIDTKLGSSNYTSLNFTHTGEFQDSQYLISMGQIQALGHQVIDDNTKQPLQQNLGLLKFQKHFYAENGNQHLIQMKLGYSDENSYESYLGLSKLDLAGNPNRRYQASSLDHMKWNHQKYLFEHITEVSSGVEFQNKIYYNRFYRNWYRLDGFRDSSVSLRQILKNPNLANDSYYRILTGEMDSTDIGSLADLRIADNERSYLSQGIKSQIHFRNNFSKVNMKHWFSLLLHTDLIKRNHLSDYYSVMNSVKSLTSGSRFQTTKNLEAAQALSFSYQNQSKFENWTWMSQFRLENASFEKNDYLLNKKNQRSDQVFIPGLGFNYEYTKNQFLGYSINEAATLSGVDIDKNESREKSLNHEFSFQGVIPEDEIAYEFIYFINDYSQLIGTCSGSSGCQSQNMDQQYVGGKALIQGLELAIAKNYQLISYEIPLQLNLTYLQGQFTETFNSQFEDWGQGVIRSGDPLPYIPQWIISTSAGIKLKERHILSLIFNHQGEMYDQSVQELRERIPGLSSWDFNYQWKALKTGTMNLKLVNVLDSRSIVSVKPFGYRMNSPRTLMASFQWGF